MKYSTEWLHNKIEAGITPEFLFFWGHTQKQTGITDKSCLSQWWPAEFVVNGKTFASAEHWMMAQKALLFNDEEQYNNIVSAESPGSAKKMGRAVKNFDALLWSEKAYAIVVEGNYHKFSQHPELKKYLLSTNEAVIVEASPFDKIWGIGSSSYEQNPSKWNGTNFLGFALMEVRDQLKI